jgi:hypothetical protein
MSKRENNIKTSLIETERVYEIDSFCCVESCCAYVNKPSVSVKDGKFLNSMSYS